MKKNLKLLDAIYNQRAIRYFKDEEIPDEIIHTLIEIATKAPSGGNSQPWRFLVVKNQDIKNEIASLYLKSWNLAYGSDSKGERNLEQKVMTSASYLAENIATAPVWVIACLNHEGNDSHMGRGASIYPAVQNFLLGCMEFGLGSVITTLHKRYEKEVKQLLGIPKNTETAALLPVGYLDDKAKYGPTKRSPVNQITYEDNWGIPFN
tara:strand:- start:29 stop:649 length:621 start_codon:yes stop_codon:yes gene_type:complete